MTSLKYFRYFIGCLGILMLFAVRFIDNHGTLELKSFFLIFVKLYLFIVILLILIELFLIVYNSIKR